MKPVTRTQPLWLLLPMIAALGVFFVYPLLSALRTSFYDWDLLTPPRFVGLANDHGLDVEIQRALLAAGIIVFENLANLDRLPEEFEFYGMPLRIRDGDGSPVRAFAVIG